MLDETLGGDCIRGLTEKADSENGEVGFVEEAVTRCLMDIWRRPGRPRPAQWRQLL
jgi:hypothetical protein